MKYQNAKKILPAELLSELQKYAEGVLVYVPGRRKGKAGWGTRNGSREQYACRNRQIARSYGKGESVEELARRYFLSTDSVRKIIREYSD